MKKLILAILFSYSLSTTAQTTSCNCQQAMQKLVVKIETEYPGFTNKTQNKAEYLQFKTNLETEAVQSDSASCPQVLKKYVDFFKDPHLWVGKNGAPFSASQNGAAAKLDIDIPSFLKSSKNTTENLVGVWSTQGYKTGITKNQDGSYTGFIIEADAASWKPGDIKFKLYPNGKYEYFLMDRSKKEGHYQVYHKTVLFQEEVGMAWLKETTETQNPEVKETLKELQGFYIKPITSKTTVLKLPSFEYHNLPTIDSLLTNGKTLLETSENLIIDLRGNPGGTTDAYQKLLPYISGKTIRHTGTEFLATQTYINNLEAYKKTLAKDANTTHIDKNIKTLKENLGKFVNFNAAGEPFYVENVTQAPLRPKQVLILANKGTGSSAEYLLFITKQSKTVKIMGSPSYGALDYGNAYITELGCSQYQVFMPTYRALRLPDYPIDNIGIQPDVYADSSTKDWLKIAVDYLEN